MTSHEVRRNVTRNLPMKGSEGTNLADGILKSVQMVNRNETNSTDTFIVIFTDGQNTASDNLHLALEEVKKSGAVVNVVAFSDKADRTLIKAVSDTGGRFYFDNNQEQSTSAVDGVLDIFSLMNSDKDKHPINILSRAKAINVQTSLTGKFQVDDTLGQTTKIIVTYVDTVPNVVVRSPTGRKYSSLYPEYTHDALHKRIKIEIPGLAEIGVWTYSVKSQFTEFERVSILVLSQQRSPHEQPLHISGAIWILDNPRQLRSQISAELIRDGDPVRDIKVKAIVERPYSDPTELELHDNGAGADAVKGDGVYSRYFNVFSTRGYYSLHLEAISNTPQTRGEDIVMATSHAGSLFLESPNLPTAHEFLLKISGSRNKEHTKDILPPMKITDLCILHTCQENETVVLSWTAPGDDDDWEQASSYTIAMSHSVRDMIDGKDITLLDPTAVIKGNLNSPQRFGEVEQMKIKLDFLPATNISLVFAVYALDESGNKGDISNLVTAGFGFVPDFNSKDYLAQRDESPEVIRVAPRKQKIMIAVVVGLFTGVLLMTILVVTAFYIVFHYKNKNKEVKDTKEVSQIV